MECCVCNPKICLFTSLSRVAVKLEFWKIDVHAAQINSGDGQKKKTKIVINKCFMHLLHATCLWTALVHSIFIHFYLYIHYHPKENFENGISNGKNFSFSAKSFKFCWLHRKKYLSSVGKKKTIIFIRRGKGWLGLWVKMERPCSDFITSFYIFEI